MWSRRPPPAPIHLALAEGQVWSHASKGPISVRCRRGSVWLTCGDGADHVLEEGAAWRARQPALIVIEALEPSTLHVAFSSMPIGGGVHEETRSIEIAPARDAACG